MAKKSSYESSLELHQKIERIKKFFDLDKLLATKTDDEYIKKYYRINQWAYSLIVAHQDRMYMAVSRNGKLQDEDFLEAAHQVEKHIHGDITKRVLELATGRGATSYYLAKKYPKVRFDGIDISSGQLELAIKKSKLVKNYFPEYGNYNDLSRYPDESFDVCFEIEALCYSHNKLHVLKEVKRVLRKGGVFISLDGWNNKSELELSIEEQLAKKISAKAMAVTDFEYYGDFLKCVNQSGLKLVESEDVSWYIMPSLRKLEVICGLLITFWPILRLLERIYGRVFSYNVIAGLLLPNSIEMGFGSYYITTLKK